MITPPRPSDCPWCGKPLDAAASVDPETRPHPGDLWVCTDCGVLLCWTSDLRRRLRPAEQAALQREDPELWAQLQQRRRYLEEG
jgi:hypothetical protein